MCLMGGSIAWDMVIGACVGHLCMSSAARGSPRDARPRRACGDACCAVRARPAQTWRACWTALCPRSRGWRAGSAARSAGSRRARRVSARASERGGPCEGAGGHVTCVLALCVQGYVPVGAAGSLPLYAPPAAPAAASSGPAIQCVRARRRRCAGGGILLMDAARRRVVYTTAGATLRHRPGATSRALVAAVVVAAALAGQPAAAGAAAGAAPRTQA
jgi:hypothetical protein